MTDIRADERVIAEWLDYAWDEERSFSHARCWLNSGGEYVSATFSTDANLWPGIMEKVPDGERLVWRFEWFLAHNHQREYSIHAGASLLRLGPEAWTRALAQAIREMKEG